MISPHYIEIESEDDIPAVQHALYAAGFCFIQGRTTHETLEECEARVRSEAGHKHTRQAVTKEDKWQP